MARFSGMMPVQYNDQDDSDSVRQTRSPVHGAKPAQSTKKGSGTAVIRNQRLSPLKRKLFASLTLLGATFVSYYVCEAVYRSSKYMQLIDGTYFPVSVTETPFQRFDPDTGFSYLPNTITRFLKFNPDDERLLVDNTIHINNKGHVSRNDDLFEKPAAEFRIAMLGDSYTACLEMREPWPDILQKLLNQDQKLKKALGVSTFKVINFGQYGIGITQCAKIHQYEVSRYDADLVVLNFVTDDLLRRFIYRNVVERDLGEFRYHIAISSHTLPCAAVNPKSSFGAVSVARTDFESPEKWLRLKKDIASFQRHRIRWLSLYPELLASRIGYRFGFHPHLEGYDQLAHYLDDDTGFPLAIEACRQIESTSRDAIFLFIPVNEYVPLQENQTMYQSPLVRRIVTAAPELNVTDMSDYLFRAISDPRELQRCFIPNDGHFTDFGGSVYAQAVYKMLQQHFDAARDGTPYLSALGAGV